MKATSRIAGLRKSFSQANQKLQDLASQDGLTGLCNRRSMDLRTDQIWLDAVARQQPFGLLMLDIDNFKKFNDHDGHQSGDDCLRNVARAIDAATSQANQLGHTQGAFAARYGGEEFAVIVPQATSQALAEVANHIVKAVHGLGVAHERNEAWGVVTISVGLALLAPAQGEVVNAFRQADARLYQAKTQGRNQVILAD